MAETKTMTAQENVAGDFQRLIDFFTTPVNLAPTREETMRAAPAAPAAPAETSPRPGFGRAVVGLGAMPQASEAMREASPAGAGREAFGRMPDLMMRPGAAPALRLPDIVEYSPAQQRVQAMAAGLEGIPVPLFAEFMGALPQRGAAPSATEQAGQTYLDMAMRNYLEGMGQAASAEEQLATEGRLQQDLLALILRNQPLGLLGEQ